MNYNEALQMVKGKNNRNQRKIANNTYGLIEYDGTVAIELHGTKVVRFFQNGLVQLNTGGWYTSTTKDRINKYSPKYVYQKKGEWFVKNDGNDIPFEDGMVV
jgi:hypothetical protein